MAEDHSIHQRRTNIIWEEDLQSGLNVLHTLKITRKCQMLKKRKVSGAQYAWARGSLTGIQDNFSLQKQRGFNSSNLFWIPCFYLWHVRCTTNCFHLLQLSSSCSQKYLLQFILQKSLYVLLKYDRDTTVQSLRLSAGSPLGLFWTCLKTQVY